MATIRQRNDRWQAIIKRTRYPQVKTFHLKKDAEKWARHLRGLVKGVRQAAEQRNAAIAAAWPLGKLKNRMSLPMLSCSFLAGEKAIGAVARCSINLDVIPLHPSFEACQARQWLPCVRTW